MSNLGIHAIYSLLNGYPEAVCERVFWDAESHAPGTRLISLESQRPVIDFPVLAFSVTYELDYLNIPSILRAGGIPVYAAERDETHPLVIAGGPCIIANPVPLSPFFDCLCIGEAEVILPAMFPVISRFLGAPRREMLEALSNVPGVWVPQVHQDQPVARQWLADLDRFPVHSTILTPDTELADLYLIEVQRGCGWACCFCLVNNAFRPRRFRSVESLVAQAEAGLQHRKRIGLVGPAVSDHPEFPKLLDSLHRLGAEISVSSLRIKPLYPALLGEMERGGAQTVALAPEAGSQRLRRAIRKGITEEDILEAMRTVAGQGIHHLKLYFMFGLPTETDEDIREMADLTLKCKAILDERNPGSRIDVSLAPFVPKAGTPFERMAMEKVPVLERRLALLKDSLPPKGIGIKNESPEWSEVQAVLARGDASLAPVLADVAKPSLAAWRHAVKKHNLDVDALIHEPWIPSRELPWSFIQ